MEHLSSFVRSPDEEDTESTSDLEFPQSEALFVLRQAVCAYFVTSYSKSLSKCSYFQGTAFFSPLLLLHLRHIIHTSYTKSEWYPCIMEIQASWSQGDGNCLFSAISLATINRLRDGDLFLQQRLASLGLLVERIEHISIDSITHFGS